MDLHGTNSNICFTSLTTHVENIQNLFSNKGNLRTLVLVQLLSAVPGGKQLATDIIKKYLQNFNFPNSFNNNNNNMPTALNLYNIEAASFNNTLCNTLPNQNLVLQDTNVLNAFHQGINLALPARNDVVEQSESVSRKRQAPDFDDYNNVTSLKRVKTENVTTQITVDDFKPYQEDNNNINLTENESTNPLQIIKTKWHVDQPSNPHIDHTHRIFNGSNLPGKSIHHNKQGFHYCMEPFLMPDTNEPSVLCLRIFDDQIEELDDELKRINRDIVTLYRNVSVSVDYSVACRINNEIDALKSRENRLKSRYACLCDARDEIYCLYENDRKPLHFNAKFITWDEVNTVKQTRRVLDSYESFYGFSNR